MAATGWLVAALLLTLGIACGLGWLAARERRLRSAAEVRHQLAQSRLDTAFRSLEARDAELSSLRCALLLAEQEAREATERARLAALSDQEVAAALPGALAALRARRAGRGPDESLATCDTAPTAPDLGGLAARESASLRPGDGLLSGAGGPGGARGLGPR